MNSNNLSDDALANLIFIPNFSIKDTATTISGRGVGMDFVKIAIEQLEGKIALQLSPEKDGDYRKFTLKITLPPKIIA